MGKKYIRDFRQDEKLADFRNYMVRNPQVTVSQAAAAYHVSRSTINKWRKLMKG
jgi:transposase-like protein